MLEPVRCLLVFVCALLLASLPPAAAEDSEFILYLGEPNEGSTWSGNATMSGTVNVPNGSMVSVRIEWALEPTIRQPGLLAKNTSGVTYVEPPAMGDEATNRSWNATIDTMHLPDGDYKLRVQAFRGDGVSSSTVEHQITTDNGNWVRILSTSHPSSVNTSAAAEGIQFHAVAEAGFHPAAVQYYAESEGKGIGFGDLDTDVVQDGNTYRVEVSGALTINPPLTAYDPDEGQSNGTATQEPSTEIGGGGGSGTDATGDDDQNSTERRISEGGVIREAESWPVTIHLRFLGEEPDPERLALDALVVSEPAPGSMTLESPAIVVPGPVSNAEPSDTDASAGPRSLDVSPVVAVPALGAGIIATGVLARESGRFAFLGLFSRITGPKVLKHERRQRILVAIEENPGIRFTQLRRRVKVQGGSLTHHLHVLLREGFIRKVKDGGKVLLFPAAIPEGTHMELHPRAWQVYNEIRQQPARPAELARRMAMSRQLLHHHVVRLNGAGLLKGWHDALPTTDAEIAYCPQCNLVQPVTTQCSRCNSRRMKT